MADGRWNRRAGSFCVSSHNLLQAAGRCRGFHPVGCLGNRGAGYGWGTRDCVPRATCLGNLLGMCDDGDNGGVGSLVGDSPVWRSFRGWSVRSHRLFDRYAFLLLCHSGNDRDFALTAVDGFLRRLTVDCSRVSSEPTKIYFGDSVWTTVALNCRCVG
jgi:hypothetical protein